MNQILDFVHKGLESFSMIASSPILLVMLLVFLGYATYTDLKHLKIYNKFNVVVALVNLGIFVIAPAMDGNVKLAIIHLLGGLIGFSALLIPSVITGFQMAGDIKFIGAFGLAIGAYAIVPFVLIASVINIITNLFLIKVKGKNLDNIIPFAPFFALSFIVLIALSL